MIVSRVSVSLWCAIYCVVSAHLFGSSACVELVECIASEIMLCCPDEGCDLFHCCMLFRVEDGWNLFCLCVHL